MPRGASAPPPPPPKPRPDVGRRRRERDAVEEQQRRPQPRRPDFEQEATDQPPVRSHPQRHRGHCSHPEPAAARVGPGGRLSGPERYDVDPNRFDEHVPETTPARDSELGLRSTSMSFDRRLYLLFTPELCRHDPDETLEAALGAGVDLVQWRCKRPNREGFERAHDRCLARRVPMIVNDDVMLALRSESHGAHVGQDDIPADAARKLMFGRLLGVSTHDLAQIRAARDARADYVGFGPCHATATKGYETGLSDDAIAAAVELCGELRLPMFAIGGIAPQNLPRLAMLGVDRIAVSSFVLGHEDPAAAVRQLRRGGR
ncbi:MAG: hypothetical protein CMJ88_00710 [Planctomycetes bacterium]|nr:hypothetical protein [Planctomycetota bacterium]